jgi:HTH-type transcriptional regulator/antitoxin HigA
MEIRPIRNDEDHRAALAEIERLWDAEPGSDDEARMDALATLVDHYEATRWPVSPVAPLEMLKFMMEQSGRTQADLGHLLGSRSRASEIMNGKRELTLDQIRLLAREWKIPVAALVGEREPA